MTARQDVQPLILASQSAARAALLKSAQIAFEAVPADLDERALQADSGLRAPEAVAEFLAQKKALEVARRRPGCYVIGADQTLALGEMLFNKPADLAATAAQLRALSGRTHHLHSAVVVVRDADVVFSTVMLARMTMRDLDDRTVADYLDRAGDKVAGSVGGYQLEGLGVHLFERIEGDYFTILGLPLLPLLAFLRSIGCTPV